MVLAVLCVLAAWSLPGESKASYPVHKDWMKGLDDDVHITELSIPGTHDSGADRAHCLQDSGCSELVHFASTQTYPIKDQLQMGVRFFDVRLAYEHGDLRFHHGDFYLHQNLADAIEAARDFMAQNPSEFVIFLIKQESTKAHNDSFWGRANDIFANYPDTLFFLKKKIPKVGDVRGKIVIMARDKSDHPQGFHVKWDGNTTHYYGTDGDLKFIAEDHYSLNSVSTMTKYLDIRHNLALARLCGNHDTLFFTFLSGEGDATLRAPSHFADYENSNVNYWLTHEARRGPRSGILAMDFAGDSTHSGAAILGTIIGQNHPHKATGPYGDTTQGGGAAIADLNNNGTPDLVVFMLKYVDTGNQAHYRIGWDLDQNGVPASWQEPQSIPWWGNNQQGAGIAAADINRDGLQDLVVFKIDNPYTQIANQGYYRVGFNTGGGNAFQWTDARLIPGWFGGESEGGGAALGDFNRNGVPDLVLLVVDNPPGNNGGYYHIGWDLDENGHPASWGKHLPMPWFGGEQQGGGISCADMNGDGVDDLVVFMVDNPSGPNTGYSGVVYLDESGGTTSATGLHPISGWFGEESGGAGAAAADLNGNGAPDLTVFFIDNPPGDNLGYYRTIWDSWN